MLGRRWLPEAEHLARVREERHLHVLANAERAPDGGDLKGAPDAFAPDLARREAEDRLAAEQDLAGVGAELAVDDVEAGGLAGAVRSDEREELSCREREAHVFDSVHAAEGLLQVAHLEKRAHPRARLAQPAIVPAMPDGKTSTSTRISTPSTPRQYGVCRITESCSTVNTGAPTSGPARSWMPPSSTITSASIERETWMVSGEMPPLPNAKSAPARPPRLPAMMKASQCTCVTAMPVASARSGESRPARIA